MSQTKELDINEKLVTTLAIIAGLILFGLTLTKCQKGASFLGLEKEVVAPITEDYTEELSNDRINLEEQMKANLEASDAELAALQAKYDTDVNELTEEIEKLKKNKFAQVPTATKAVAATAAVGAVSLTDFDALKAKLTAKNTELATLKAQLSNTDGADTDLVAQNADLRAKLDTLTLEKNSIAKTAADTQKELNDKIKELSANKQGNADDLIKDKIAEADTQWKKQIDQLKVDHELAKAKQQQEFNAKLAEYRNIARASKAKKVFATSTDDLAPAAKSLINSLDGYKGTSEADLNGLYSNIGSKQNAKRKLIVNFASGSSAVGAEYQEKIKALLEKASPNSYLLAVGYADTTGTASKNKALSSKRATKVAQVIKPNLNKSQFTQAYYLGQTTRFGADENNRIVEIWEITE